MARRITTAATLATKRSWLDQRSEQHEELGWLWAQNERRYEGGHLVRDELWRFDWETLSNPDGTILRDGMTVPRRATATKDTLLDMNTLRPGEHYRRRQDSATYINFMGAFATDIVGHLFRQAPAPDNGLDFGTLGEVRRREDIDTPTRAELRYYNTDGVGSDGSQWDIFWGKQAKLAMVTGYRWIYVDAPIEPPRTQARELRGFRPYLVAFSPRDVWNYQVDNGTLQWAIVKIAVRRPRVVNDIMEGNRTQLETLVLVRRGNTDLGAEFAFGGWWRFDTEKELVASGNWEKTEGEIPMSPLIYDPHPYMLGRPGTTELGNSAVAAMNIHSCADFDAFDSAGSVIALRGVDAAGFDLFIEKVRNGNRFAPLMTNQESGKDPSVENASQGVTVADVFEKRLLSLERAVDRIRGTEVASAPQASGLAMQGGFTMGNVPRLTLFAGNIETCQNAANRWDELRSGFRNPRGSARWRKQFELIKLTSSAQALLQLEAIAGINSEELDSRVIVAAAKDEGFVTDNATSTKIEGELRASRKRKIANEDKALAAKTAPQVPGSRKRNMPPEPAQDDKPVKSQIDGPNVE